MKLDNEYLTIINNIVKYNKYEYCKKSDSYNIVDLVVLLVICLCIFIGYTNNQNILLIGCSILLIVYNFLVFLIISENKKENSILEKEYKNTLELIFDNIDKNYLTILSLKELIDDLERHKLIYKTYIDKENFEYKSDITIKQFKDLLKNKIYKNEKKKEKFLNQI